MGKIGTLGKILISGFGGFNRIFLVVTRFPQLTENPKKPVILGPAAIGVRAAIPPAIQKGPPGTPLHSGYPFWRNIGAPMRRRLPPKICVRWSGWRSASSTFDN